MTPRQRIEARLCWHRRRAGPLNLLAGRVPATVLPGWVEHDRLAWVLSQLAWSVWWPEMNRPAELADSRRIALSANRCYVEEWFEFHGPQDEPPETVWGHDGLGEVVEWFLTVAIGAH